MRINKFIASASHLSRRAADQAIAEGRILVDGQPPNNGYDVTPNDTVTLDGLKLTVKQSHTTISLNKPVGYVCSRNGQGSSTIYDLLPPELQNLNPIGRLDKDSSGLLLMTTNGELANQLTHPRYEKTKVYEVSLDKPLTDTDRAVITAGVMLEDGPSALQLTPDNRNWTVAMHEGRNRQIRRTFASLGYTVTRLHRTTFGEYELGGLPSGQYITQP